MRGGCAPTRRYLDQSTASQRTQCGAAVALGIRDPFGLVWSCAWKGGGPGRARPAPVRGREVSAVWSSPGVPVYRGGAWGAITYMARLCVRGEG